MIRYCGPFLFLASIPFFFYCVGGCSPFATVGLLLAALIGAEWFSPRGGGEAESNLDSSRVLPLLYIPMQLAVTGWALWAASKPAPWPVIYVSLVVSVGVTTGVFGVLAAHELAHSQNRLYRAMATAMLSAMTYRQFRIAHLYGHHRWAGTDRDAATARLGEGFYGFLVRTVSGQFAEAWNFEEHRRAARGKSVLTNRVLQDVAVMALIFTGIDALFGWRGLLFFVSESAVGIVVLELFNYIAHYGLIRDTRRGRREALGEMHSWNSSNLAANLLVFNMGRHSDHHRAPSAPYATLAYLSDAPELPAGYAGSILLALVPPLWRRVMDPLVLRLRAGPVEHARRAA